MNVRVGPLPQYVELVCGYALTPGCSQVKISHVLPHTQHCTHSATKDGKHTQTHQHSHTRWHRAIPEGKQWIEKGSERCFGLPAEPPSSELRGLALPGPQGEDKEEEGKGKAATQGVRVLGEEGERG